jgi:hypothetical protein
VKAEHILLAALLLYWLLPAKLARYSLAAMVLLAAFIGL